MSMLITVQTLLITVAILLVVYELKQCIHIKLQNLEFVVLISQVFILPGVCIVNFWKILYFATFRMSLAELVTMTMI